MYNGIINIYKEKAFTSHDVVAKLRGILKQKKIGHTGTLDPDAVGVLPVCLGKGTKLCDMLTDKDKVYETVFLLGMTTDTQDISGKVLSESNTYVDKTQDEIENAIMSFVGEYNQVPPMYSALKVNGKKLYELAREGKVIEREPRKVYIKNIDIKNISEDKKTISMKVECSKGTYIRTLCHDIGEKLGCGACMKELVRTRVSSFEIESALKLSEVEELVSSGDIEKVIFSIEKAFTEYPKLVIPEELMKFLKNGNKISAVNLTLINESNIENKEHKNWVRVYDCNNEFCAVYELDKNKNEYKPVKMFMQ